MGQHLLVFQSLALLLAAGLVALPLARWSGVPDLLWFMMAGFLLGPQVGGLVQLSGNLGVSSLIVTGGAVFMLYEGGRAVEWRVLRRIWQSVAVLAVVGTMLTALGVALLAVWLLGVPWVAAALLGAVVASTDPATIVPLFARLKLPARLAQLLIGEAALNDAMSALLVVLIVAASTGAAVGWAVTGLSAVRLLVLGAVAGLGIGGLVQWGVAEGQRLAVWNEREEAVVSALPTMAVAYLAAVAIGGSGFIAAFAAGMVSGNAHILGLAPKRTHQAEHQTFLWHLGTVVRILLFGLLGAEVVPAAFAQAGWVGLAVAAGMIVVLRPLVVWVTLWPDRWARWRPAELWFASWVRETGVMAAALASLLIVDRVPGASEVGALTTVVLVVTMLVQVPTTKWWAVKLGLVTADAAPARATR
ncbi:MAG: cation:proton antiporter [Sulfobacillus sp.]